MAITLASNISAQKLESPPQNEIDHDRTKLIEALFPAFLRGATGSPPFQPQINRRYCEPFCRLEIDAIHHFIKTLLAFYFSSESSFIF
jgi:hypothetical protein